MQTKRRVVLAGALALALAPLAMAGDVTAFELIKEGNHYVGDQSKDKVVNIHSEKSVASLTPNIWYVVYYDPDATLKAVEVKFGAGQKMKVTHPLRLLEPVTGEDKVLDRSKLNVDSDRALKIATSRDTPGPMVEQMVALFMYLPLAAGGLALTTALIRLEAFSTSFSCSMMRRK